VNAFAMTMVWRVADGFADDLFRMFRQSWAPDSWLGDDDADVGSRDRGETAFNVALDGDEGSGPCGD